MGNVFKLLPIAREEYRAGPRAITASDDISSDIGWGVVWGRFKWLVESTVARRSVSDRSFMKA